MSEPYYRDELVELWHGDCLEIDAWLQADVLVTDPPYGMALKTGKRKGRLGDFGDCQIEGDADTSARDAVVEAWGLVRPALMFGRWSVERPVGVKTLLTWEKGNHTGMGNLNIPWSPTTEEIYVLGKWPPRENKGKYGGGRSAATLLVNAPAPSRLNGRQHPTEKPVGLLHRLIDKCPPGVIADPFAGSGSTLVAAKALGRHAIGVELEERYCETAAKRLAQGVLV